MHPLPNPALDPWSSIGGDIAENHWRHDSEHPLDYISDLLRNWPSHDNTVDLENEERHLRFVQVIAGYPKISGGMYPLDWPTHPESIKALRLSLFLDSLNVPEKAVKNCKIHSVRSAILALDAQMYNSSSTLTENISIRALHHQCLTLLFHSLRVWEGIPVEDEFSPNSKESLLMNTLHSSDSFGHGFWLKRWTYPSKNKLITLGGKGFNIRHIQTFELTGIQNWILQWSKLECETHPLEDNIRQNLLVGASVMLECLFSKLRRYAITNYRPGSILVDGGGRIRLYCVNPKLQQEITRLIEHSFFGFEYDRHRYSNVVESTVEKYIKASGVKCLHPCSKMKQGSKKENIDCPSCGSQHLGKEVDKSGKLSQAAFRRLLLDDRVGLKFYPPMKFNNEKKEHGGCKVEACPLCYPLIHGPKIEKQNTWTKIPGTCFFHALMYEIGKAHKRRDLSSRKLGGYSKKIMQVHSCAMIDLNALGVQFNQIPNGRTREITCRKSTITTWNSERGLSHNPKLEPALKKDLYEKLWSLRPFDFLIYGIEDGDIHHIYNQILVLKSRRSFQFNAKWWSCVAEISEEGSFIGEIAGWITAGDDLLLVRRGEIGAEDQTLKRLLEKLDQLLKTLFANSSPAFSFGAGLAYRTESSHSISDLISLVYDAEKKAKNNWKTRAFTRGRKELVQEINPEGEFIMKDFDQHYDFEKKGSKVFSIFTEKEAVESSIFCVEFTGKNMT